MADAREISTARSEQIAALPIWKGSIEIRPMIGGISNESWLVTDDSGGHVVRFGKDYPFHHVLRDRELMTARAAEAAALAPAVEHAAPGVMVCKHLNARTYGEADVRSNLERIARLVRNFHQQMPHHVSGPGFMFWPFHVIRDYARTLDAGGSRMRAHLPAYLALADELEAVQVPLPVIFGHNDLLPANLLDDAERLWLIDFEYAGFSTAMFDLAGLSSNASFSDEESEALLGHYFNRSPDTPLRRSLAGMQCASLLREAMWSMVSELYLDAPGTDYVAYTQENLSRLEAALDTFHTQYGRVS
ncbi:phosphotransferase family protein [uncultured Nitratireductor sp.]|uniref:phosphotransferase family protein n=1 Tax=uncultured Nitratireductor sp. TaxID=520953 RepID=UPI0025E03CC5|nr:phosphotransferase family protein [uncultured Nitratireductor sp.]